MNGFVLVLGYLLAGTLTFSFFMGLLWLLLRTIQAFAARSARRHQARFDARNTKRLQTLQEVTAASKAKDATRE